MNIYFVYQYVDGLGITEWYYITIIAVFAILYLVFCFYLTIDMIIHMGGDQIRGYHLIQNFFSHQGFEALT